MDPRVERSRILYIGGSTRTGSTLLDSLLGSFPGVFSGGELTFFWRYGMQEGGRCSCGVAVVDCPVWSEVLQRVFAGGMVNPERMVELRNRFWSIHLPLMAVPALRRRGLAKLEEYPRVLERLYHSIAETTDARLIVDSSKEPHYSYILREATDLDVYFLHLVRDPRAVGSSWLRARPELGFGEDTELARLGPQRPSGYHHAERRSPLQTSAYYDVSNVASEMLWKSDERYAFLRYEDFVERPTEALESISEFVGVDLDVGSVLDANNSFERPSLHSAWGNPNRFEQGRTVLESDDAWTTRLSKPNRAVITALTIPLMARYGYRIEASRKPSVPRGRPAARRLPGRTTTPKPALAPRTDALSLLGGFFRVRSDPEPFLAGLAHRAIDKMPFPLENREILDLGCGTGHLAIELQRRGHSVVSTDLRFADLVQGRPPGAFCGDATNLSVRSGSIDGVICSNILEHTPTPDLVFDEIARVLRPGGWAWVSWTPWWTPFGGHAIAPFHYLGADRGQRVYNKVIGEPRGENLPYDGVWPTSVASMIELVEAHAELELADVLPRYYTSLRWLMKLRHVREVAVWNCVLLIRKAEGSSAVRAMTRESNT